MIRSKGNTVEVLGDDGSLRREQVADPLGFVKEYLGKFLPVEVEGLPRFFGGAVGYLGYDMVRYFERLSLSKPIDIDAYDSYFVITDTILVFDNIRQKIKVVSNAHVEPGTKLEDAYSDATAKIEAIIKKLKAPLNPTNSLPPVNKVSFSSNITRQAFEESVLKAKEYVKAGDIIQVVLSQRFSAELTVDPFNIYRALRTLNPSPYMFFLRLDDTLVVGASPEVMVRKEGVKAELRPIAGTRPRGATAYEDEQLELELLADPKERAEHVMLVDLGRNDLGLPLYDPATGGCYDGLHSDRVNENQGAESTLAFLLAALELRLAEVLIPGGMAERPLPVAAPAPPGAAGPMPARSW